MFCMYIGSLPFQELCLKAPYHSQTDAANDRDFGRQASKHSFLLSHSLTGNVKPMHSSDLF